MGAQPATRLRLKYGPGGNMERIAVYVQADDPISQAGVASQLRRRPEVRILDGAEPDSAAVAVVVRDRICERTIQVLRTLQRGGSRPVLVVAEAGIAGLLRRAEATPERLVTVIRAAAAGEGAVPPDLLGRLLDQVGHLQRRVLWPRGLTFAGLAEREIEVLRLVADGLDTAEIATKLSYSQRTVKNVLHDVTTRLHLRNRCHAVAYALRHGLI